MKKTVLLFFALILVCPFAKAQRYLSPIFSGVNSILNIQYGTNTNYKGLTTNLELDFYEPQGDTLSQRPLIIYVHGGGFIDTNQSKSLPHIVAFADSMARRGYAVASINYRLDTSISNRAVINAMHDAKAAVRFFKANASNYSLDTNLFFIGGESAGAITALTTNYINNTTEVKYPPRAPFAIDTTVDGNSGNPGYGSSVKATLCFCGGTQNVLNELLFDTLAMVQNDQPILFVHGTSDPLIPVQYAAELALRAINLGIPNLFYTLNGATHCPWIFSLPNATAYLDTLIDYTVPFLYACVQGSTGFTQYRNVKKLNIYPNPSSGQMMVQLTASSRTGDVLLKDITGRIVYRKSIRIENGAIQFDFTDYIAGRYRLEINTSDGIYGASVVIRP